MKQYQITDEELLAIINTAVQEKTTSLDLGSKGIKKLPQEIENLSSTLTTLHLNDNKLSEFPSEIVQLINLERLSINNNGLISLSAEIGKLENLKFLSISYNDLTSLPTEIGKLEKLTHLSIHSNRLKNLPREFENLNKLTDLNLSSCGLTNLPDEILKLSNLISLNFSGNILKYLPSEIFRLVNLENFDLSYNRLKNLPTSIGQLSNLTRLDLANNLLTSLPQEIGKLSNLKELTLAYSNDTRQQDNPLSSLPPEVRWKDGMSVFRFYRQQLEQKTDRIYEAKLLILGEGGAGKTTLAKKIRDQDYSLLEHEISTKGIDIIQWSFPYRDGKEFRVNIWDFGGQEIYHATHQFFLTKRSLYILVADSRNEDTDFYYWLNVVELLSDNSPLIIVSNEKQNRKREINERRLRGKFQNFKETLPTNLATNRGLPEILIQIKHFISNLPHVGTELPKGWIKVREALEQDPRNYISLDDYLKICQNNGFARREDNLQLSEYLHDLGVCLHFQEDDLLSKTVILKPTWGTDAVYKVLDNLQVIQNQGKFTKSDLVNIWSEDKYVTMHPELLRLMINFKLCYEIPSCPGTYIAPQLLTHNQPEYSWDKTENLLLRYEYEFMPKGICNCSGGAALSRE